MPGGDHMNGHALAMSGLAALTVPALAIPLAAIRAAIRRARIRRRARNMITQCEQWCKVAARTGGQR
jgi:hypothetical protein